MASKIWSEDEEKTLSKLYTELEHNIEAVAQKMNKSPRSIITKLVKMKIYIKPVIEQEEKIRVKGMIHEIEKLLGIKIEGINIGKKSNLTNILEGVQRLHANRN